MFFSALISFLLLLRCSVHDVAENPTCDTEEIDQFSFTRGAFRFSDQSDGSSVTFYVTAVVCLDDGSQTTCKTECDACSGDELNRKRREAVEDSLATKYYLKSGPYIFKDVKKGLYLC